MLEFQGLELQTVVSCHVNARNGTQVFWKGCNLGLLEGQLVLSVAEPSLQALMIQCES